MSRLFQPAELLRNTTNSMAQGTLGGTIRVATPTLERILSTGAKRHTQAGSGFGTPTFFVAASDAPDEEKEVANYICDGSTDAATIQGALDEVGAGSRVVLSNGTFNLESGLVVSGIEALEGLGYGSILKFQASRTYNAKMIDSINTDIRNLTLDGNMANQPTPVYTGDWWHCGQFGIYARATTEAMIVENVLVQRFTNVGVWYGDKVNVLTSYVYNIGVIGQNPTSHPGGVNTTLGIGFESGGTDTTISSCVAEGCQNVGFKFVGNREVGTVLGAVGCGLGGTDPDDMDFDIEYGSIGVYSSPTISNVTTHGGHHGVVVFSGAEVTTALIVSPGGSAVAGYPSTASFSHFAVYQSAGNGVFFIDPQSTTVDNFKFYQCGNSTHDGILLRPYTPGAALAGDNNIIRNCDFNENTTARYHIKIYDTSIHNTWVYMNDMRVSGLTGRLNNNGIGTVITPGNRGIDF